MRINNYKLKTNKTMDKNELISKLFDRLSETNMALDRATTDLGEENLGFHEEHFYLDLLENLAPNEELLIKVEGSRYCDVPDPSDKYLLFGEDAIKTLEEEGVEALITEIEEGNIYPYQTHVHKTTDSIFETLTAFQGYFSYSSLSKEEYYQIENI